MYDLGTNTFRLVDDDELVPSAGSSSELTRTIQLDRRLFGGLTHSGSFDVGNIRTTSIGRLINCLPIPALLVSTSFQILFANAACSKLGVDAPELEGSYFSSLFPSYRAGKKALTLLALASSTRRRQVAEATVGSGERRIWGRLHMRSIRVGGERLVLALIEDLTFMRRQLELKQEHENELRKAYDALDVRVKERTAELVDANELLKKQIANRRLAEHELRRSKETIEALLNSMDDEVVMLDPNGVCLHSNLPAASRFNLPAEEAPGKSLYDLLPTEKAESYYHLLGRVIETGKKLVYQEGANGRVFDISLHPVFTSSGVVGKVVLVSRDVTEQKKAQDLAARSERIKALGEMAGGVAHNFNNLLQIVMGGAELAKNALLTGDSEEVDELLDSMLEAARLGSDTVRRLQEFACVRERPCVDKGSTLDLSRIAREALEISGLGWKSAPKSTGRKIQIHTDLGEGCIVRGRNAELFEVIVNLIKNAAEALPEGGDISISTKVRKERVILEVADNGVGIAKEDLDRVFEPFWTSKGFKGAGLGLAGSLGVIQSHQGVMTVESEPGEGTAFRIQLPVAEDIEVPSTMDTHLTEAPSLKVLIIDDVESLLTVVGEGLSLHGHSVLTASSGGKGLELLDQEPVDVIICDLGMPEMNGWEVALRVEEICRERSIPKVPFILMTGWGGQIPQAEELQKLGVDRVVEKPIQLSALVETLYETTNQPSGDRE